MGKIPFRVDCARNHLQRRMRFGADLLECPFQPRDGRRIEAGNDGSDTAEVAEHVQAALGEEDESIVSAATETMQGHLVKRTSATWTKNLTTEARVFGLASARTDT